MSDREMSAQDLLEHLYRGLNMERDAQVKISTQESLELAPPREIEQTKDCAERSAVEMPAEETVTAMTEPLQAVHARTVSTSAGRRRVSPRIVLAVSVAVTGIMVVGARYEYSTPDRRAASSMTTVLQKASQLETSVPTSDAEVEPVLFANPFDEAEVFEFPPGTSESEARDAVADMLMKRAMERQAHLWR